MNVCQFPLAAYYEKVARARVVKFSHKIRPVQPFVVLTRAPLGYFDNAPHWGGGANSSPPPPLISETTWPILKIQTAFERPGKTVEGKQILLTSGSRVTSQVRSKSKCLTFRAW